ncbi:dihydroneopterin aldolase [Pseudolactococcus insecticola]|uniref:7,8-dihydroneopterin aldolase n=1 Tax=Pseudolactococcus insecticola TaxID=2709158 RepID=A0A6A0B9N7_9LACT|nr:dihydroneopterin aldolase [Lactococcus insecticola]GFH40527.1 7,8-dihydroneopterin aldolase [Lactococcus insecticola]
MGKIEITNMRFYTHNGVFAEEKKLGQQISVDVCVIYDIEHLVKDDDLATTISYAAVFDVIENYVTTHDFNLMESLANGTLTQLLQAFSMAEEIELSVKKYSVPIAGVFDDIIITVSGKNDLA